MNKKILLGLVVIATLLAAYVVKQNYSPLGRWIYQQATDIEAQFYGLEQTQVNIGAMDMALYRYENPGKPTILMLHGFSADKDVWPRFAKHFFEDYQVLIPDLAGHGDTGFDAAWDYSMLAQAERLSQLLKALQVNKVHVIGNSMGGFLAAVFSLQYPDQVLSATFIDPAGLQAPAPSEMDKMLAAGSNPFFFDTQEEFDRFYPMTMAQPPYFPGIVLAGLASRYIEKRPQLEHIFADFSTSTILQNRLASLKVPALLWWGSEDQLLDPSSITTWQQYLPSLQTYVWQGVGHMVMLEAPTDAAERYQAFLQSLPQ